jgi:hypothetical protein
LCGQPAPQGEPTPHETQEPEYPFFADGLPAADEGSWNKSETQGVDPADPFMPSLVDILDITGFCRLGSVFCARHAGAVCYKFISNSVITPSRHTPLASARNAPLHCLNDMTRLDSSIQAVPFVFWRQFTHRWFIMNL